jgi:hypothetical protein
MREQNTKENVDRTKEREKDKTRQGMMKTKGTNVQIPKFQDKTTHDIANRTRQDKAGQDNRRSSNHKTSTRQHKTRQDKTNETRQDK